MIYRRRFMPAIVLLAVVLLALAVVLLVEIAR